MKFLSVAFLFSLLLVVVTSASHQFQCACPRNYSPVCAMNSLTGNSETFSNMCMLECESQVNSGLRFLRSGECSWPEVNDEVFNHDD